MARIAINGLGRIGKLVLRNLLDLQDSSIEIILVNEPVGNVEQHALLLEFDTVHGRWLADINANNHTGPGGKYEGYPIKMVSVERSFHGRTDRPAQISHSCKNGYDKNLATFQNRDNLILVPANDPDALEAIFQRSVDEKFFIELVAIEPIQGEGNPGLCVSREFYDAARRLTNQYDSMLLVDSIQAGIRGQGCLSVIDYDGFQDAEVPDLETWSKAINAGQYPLSVLGMNERSASMYVVGIYGNTMTTNPRALETAVAVLEQITPELRKNIKDRGEEFVDKLNLLITSQMVRILLKSPTSKIITKPNSKKILSTELLGSVWMEVLRFRLVP